VAETAAVFRRLGRSDDREGGLRRPAELLPRRILLIEVAAQPAMCMHTNSARARVPLRHAVACLIARLTGARPGGNSATVLHALPSELIEALSVWLAADPQLQQRNRASIAEAFGADDHFAPSRVTAVRTRSSSSGSRRCTAHLAARSAVVITRAPASGAGSTKSAFLQRSGTIDPEVARVPRGHLRRGRAAVQYGFGNGDADRRGTSCS